MQNMLAYFAESRQNSAETNKNEVFNHKKTRPPLCADLVFGTFYLVLMSTSAWTSSSASATGVEPVEGLAVEFVKCSTHFEHLFPTHHCMELLVISLFYPAVLNIQLQQLLHCCSVLRLCRSFTARTDDVEAFAIVLVLLVHHLLHQGNESVGFFCRQSGLSRYKFFQVLPIFLRREVTTLRVVALGYGSHADA